MEIRLILSYSHFTRNNNGFYTKVSQKSMTINTSGVNRFLLPCIRVEDRGSPMVKLVMITKFGLFYPAKTEVFGEKVETGYRYSARLTCYGKLLHQMEATTERPISMSTFSLGIMKSGRLQELVMKAEDCTGSDAWFPFKLQFHDGLVSFEDPSGSNFSGEGKYGGTTLFGLSIRSVLKCLCDKARYAIHEGSRMTACVGLDIAYISKAVTTIDHYLRLACEEAVSQSKVGVNIFEHVSCDYLKVLIFQQVFRCYLVLLILESLRKHQSDPAVIASFERFSKLAQHFRSLEKKVQADVELLVLEREQYLDYKLTEDEERPESDRSGTET